jgi:uncharacterized protein YndB with AHSA1/START domain
MNRATYTPSPVGGAECCADGGRWTLSFVRELRHPPEMVWAALTEPEQLSEWSPYAADEVTVTRSEAPRLLECTWETDALRWDLEAIDGGTRLTLRHTFADRDGAPRYAAGWHLCFDVLGHFLDGQPVGAIRGEEAKDYGWEDLHDAYAEKLRRSGS